MSTIGERFNRVFNETPASASLTYHSMNRTGDQVTLFFRDGYGHGDVVEVIADAADLVKYLRSGTDADKAKAKEWLADLANYIKMDLSLPIYMNTNILVRYNNKKFSHEINPRDATLAAVAHNIKFPRREAASSDEGPQSREETPYALTSPTRLADYIEVAYERDPDSVTDALKRLNWNSLSRNQQDDLINKLQNVTIHIPLKHVLPFLEEKFPDCYMTEKCRQIIEKGEYF